jgi:hypothetical protein
MTIQGRGARALVAVGVLIALAGAAAADALEASGQARGTGAQARTAAIDQAFAVALERALEARLTPAARASKAAPLREQIVGRARRFVASFQVISEADRDGAVRVTVRVTLDDAKLDAALAELGLAARAAPAAPAAAARPKVALLLKATIGDTTRATFGVGGGDGGVAGRVLGDELGARGLELASAVGQAVPVATGSDAEGGLVPLDEAQAAEVGRAIGAGIVVVVGLRIDGSGPIRSTALRGAAARGVIRIVAGGERVAEASIDAGGFGADPDAALADAAHHAARRLIAGVAGELERRWPGARVAPDAVALTVRGQQSWGPVAAVIRKLGTTAGIDGVAVRQARRGAVELGLRTAIGAGRVVAALRGLALPSGRLAARTRGEAAIDVEVSGDAPFATGLLDDAPAGPE